MLQVNGYLVMILTREQKLEHDFSNSYGESGILNSLFS